MTDHRAHLHNLTVPSKQKIAPRKTPEQVAAEVAEFLARGGKIQQIPLGVTAINYVVGKRKVAISVPLDL